ncbi:DUF2924 domain-containing protein [Mesorhizobium sp. BR1-1-16]|uniref:DUF2924 domain-containing protein n=1 Tax=Mesorhizobium sp. BR1-1-16 TaxID=2876653 RepID=UPI002570247A|nr:DUF2924 domain-containing protein [Mesorhizobium sp. BR1-1-16]
MTASLAKRLAELETMDTAALKVEWRRLFRSQPPALSHDLLKRAIGHRYQEIALAASARPPLASCAP